MGNMASENVPAPLFVLTLINRCANGSFFVSLATAVVVVAPHSTAASIALMVFFWALGYRFEAPLSGVLIEMLGADIFYAARTGVLATLLVVAARLRLDAEVIKKL